MRELQSTVAGVPFQSLVLDFTMLVVQGLEQSIGEFSGGSPVAGEEGRALVAQNTEEVVQGHESQVGIRIIQLGKQAEDGLLGHLSVRHDENGYNEAD